MIRPFGSRSLHPRRITAIELALAAAVSVLVSSEASAQTSLLTLDAQAGAGVGFGKSGTYTTSNGSFTTSRLSGGGVEVRFSGAGSWTLDFVAPDGASLLPGIYEGARRVPFQSPTQPGLDVSGDGAGCNTVTGRFVVLEAVYAMNGAVQSFAADFEQHCEGVVPALFGSVRINSSVPRVARVSVNSVSAYEGSTLQKYMGFTVSLSQPVANEVSVSYSTADLSAVAGVDYVAAIGTVIFPAGSVNQSIAVALKQDLSHEVTKSFQLNLSSPAGAALGFGQGTGRILDDDGPATGILFNSQPGDYIGAGVARRYTPLEGSFTTSRVDNGVHVHFDHDSWWDLYFIAPQKMTLVPGTYEGAARHPFQSSTQPGFDVSGDGRGCNILTGQFVVLEATYGAGGVVETFAADFEQHCEGHTPALFGSVRINSTWPLPELAAPASAGRLSAGGYHTCALTDQGGVKCWGNNLDGQLGDGSVTPRSIPVNVSGLSDGVISVSAGGYHTCALTSAGGVKCWGYNGHGELGDGTTASRTTPVDVLGLTTGVISISADLYHTCAVTALGRIKCWGNNLDGQLGDGTTTQRVQPSEVWALAKPAASVSTGAYHTCAVVDQIAVNCWGFNDYGQIGNGTVQPRGGTPTATLLGAQAASVSSGLFQTCAVIRDGGGGAKCWGNNQNGQLGNGGTSQSTVPAAVSGPGAVPTNIATGSFHTCATTDSGAARCWGSNLNGKLGDGTTTQRTTPVSVAGLTSGVTEISTGAQHSCALTSAGVKCWGLNADGQLGDGTTTSRSTPVSVAFFQNDGTASLAAPTVTSPMNGQVLNANGAGFSWTSVAGATGYDLRVVDLNTWSIVFSGSVAGGSSTSTLATLGAGAYRFAVRACSGGFAASQCGAYGTASFTITPTSPSGGPTITFPTQGAGLTSSTQTLTWTAVAPNPALAGLNYEVVLRDLTAGTTALQITVPSPNLSTIFTMKSSTQYELKVRSCQAGCGPWSTAVTFSLTLPPVPSLAPAINSCAVSGGNSLTCNWGAVANADAYQVQVVQPPPAGPGGGALTVAAVQTSSTTVTLPVPPGTATVFIAACNGDGCGPNATFGITATGVNPSQPNIGTPMAGTVVSGPGVLFTWNRVPGDTGSNTRYRLFVQDLSRQSTALDVFTTNNFYSAFFKAEGARYDALVVSNPGLAGQQTGPAQGFNVSGASSTAPTMVSPAHNSTVPSGNIQLGWSPVPGATLYEYFVAVLGQGSATARGVTPGFLAQVPLSGTGPGTLFSGIVRACPANATCAPGSDAGWGPWSNAPGGPGVTNFTVVP